MFCGGYSPDLYCDNHKPLEKGLYDELGHLCDEFPHQFFGETLGECKKKARNKGWVFHKDNTETCPKCNK